MTLKELIDALQAIDESYPYTEVRVVIRIKGKEYDDVYLEKLIRVHVVEKKILLIGEK